LPINEELTTRQGLISSAQEYDMKRPIGSKQQNYSSFSPLIAERNGMNAEESMRTDFFQQLEHMSSVSPHPGRCPWSSG